MEIRHNLVLAGTETFSKGSLDNAALEGGCIVLDGIAGRHMPFGCYTTPEFAMPPFCNLNVSWNADTPPHTVVEVQCRLLAGGSWTGWMGFGKWSPDYPRSSPGGGGAQSNLVFCSGENITVAVSGGGVGGQRRVYLYSDDEKQTPAVRMLAVAARPHSWEKQFGRPDNRRLYLPCYLAGNHDQSFGASMTLPLTLAALMNRYGEDVLPEELAYGMSDGATASCRNAAYAAAMAGSCGYRCRQVWADVKDLREEIRGGYAVAVELEPRPGSRDAATRWAGLYGFLHDEKRPTDQVLLCDPTDEEGSGEVQLTLEEFRQQFTGRALFLRPRERGVRLKGGGFTRPLRYACSMKRTADPGVYLFEHRSEVWPLPEGFDGWLAASPRDGQAHATTAGRTFHRLEPAADGAVRLPAELLLAGARYTLYAVDTAGVLWAAELRLPANLPPPPEKEPAKSLPADPVSNAEAAIE